MILKSLRECLAMLPSIPYMPADSCSRDTYKRRLLAREYRIKQRIAALKNGLEPARHLVDVLQRALEKEERRLHEGRRKRTEAVGAILDPKPPSGMYVSPVHGNTGQAPEEEQKKAPGEHSQTAKKEKGRRHR